MKSFGETVRELRTAQELGLRETAVQVGISPAYLSRIERNIESPPSPEIIKRIAKLLAADPDILFRLSSSSDPELESFIHKSEQTMKLLRLFYNKSFEEELISKIVTYSENLHKKTATSTNLEKEA
jgi:transcriptional regulator with XRE-family HTH domain